MSEKNNGHNLVYQDLLSSGILPKEKLDMALEHLGISKNRTFLQIVVELNFMPEERILSSLIESSNDIEQFVSSLPIEQIKDISKFSNNLVQGKSELRKHVIVSVSSEKKEVIIATPEILERKNLDATRSVYERMGYSVRFWGCTFFEYYKYSKLLYLGLEGIENQIKSLIEKEEHFSTKTKAFLTLLVEEAAILKSSDIYFQRNEKLDYSYVFFKFADKKEYKYVLPTKIMNSFLVSIKNLANMEAGLIGGVQDGSLEIEIFDKKYRLNTRINTVTTIAGEHVAMRIPTNDLVTLKAIGFNSEDAKNIRKVLLNRQGVVVVAGKTGSGKTTTMHAMIAEFDPYEYNIITIEDPAEIIKKGVNQIEINEMAGQDAESIVRAILRQSPDIIVLGEIRDKETALKVHELSNTGHLVLCTMHTSSLAGIKDRLLELGVENTETFMKHVCISVYQKLEKRTGGDAVLNYELAIH